MSLTITDADTGFMLLALETATKGRFLAAPNPAVGCVLVRDGVILATGYTHAPGSAHAEVDAVRKAEQMGYDVARATAYVTLEPCSHYGRTPPCAQLLIDKHVARVVVGTLDPNPLVAGKGVEMLRQAGIEVTVGLCEAECRESNIGFITRMCTGLPWVRMKLACSIDGLTALPNGASQWITDTAARQDGQRMRAQAQGLLTGIGTVFADDPRMNVRVDLSLPSPRKYVLDSHANMSPAARILQGEPTIVFVSARAFEQKVRGLREAGAQVRVIAEMPEGGLNLAQALNEIASDGVNVLHVEAGAKLNGSLLRAGLVDEIVCYMAPALLGRGAAWADLPELSSMDQVERWHYHDVRRIGPDLRVILRKHTNA